MSAGVSGKDEEKKEGQVKTIVLLTLLSMPQTRADYLNWSLGAADAAQTAHFLVDHSGRENWNPTQSAPGNVALIMGSKMAETMIAHKCHRKACRALPWIASAGSAFAVGYSFSQPRAQHCIAVPSSIRATYVCH
jgi:hypothetical protein